MAAFERDEQPHPLPSTSSNTDVRTNGIVICYRRDDAAGSAGRLYDRLCGHFGKDKVFMDVDAIPPGVDFAKYILTVITNSDVLLAIIGPRWITLQDANGRRRLDQEDDVVRLEITTALKQRVQIIPVLVDAATMPAPNLLPTALKRIAELNAIELSHRRFRDGVTELLPVIEIAAKTTADRRASHRDARTRLAELEKEKEALEKKIQDIKGELASEVGAAIRELQQEIEAGVPAIDNQGLAERPYAAFLLYSHAADRQLAATLEHALQTIGKPWYVHRNLRIFRDKADLSATPALWQALTQAIDQSKYLVLLASTAAAHSLWVEREVQYWLQHRSSTEILLVLTDGDISWDNGANDFDWERTTALPSSLRGRFISEPLYVDFRWMKSHDQMDLANPEFKNAVATLAATISGKTKRELLREDERQHWRARGVVGGIFAIVGIVLLLTLYVVLKH